MKRVILNGPDFCAVTEDGRLTEYIQLDPKELTKHPLRVGLSMEAEIHFKK